MKPDRVIQRLWQRLDLTGSHYRHRLAQREARAEQRLAEADHTATMYRTWDATHPDGPPAWWFPPDQLKAMTIAEEARQ